MSDMSVIKWCQELHRFSHLECYREHMIRLKKIKEKREQAEIEEKKRVKLNGWL
jgi:hypothetical protein